MISCYVIDDEYPAIKIIEKFILQTPSLEFVGSATNPILGIDEVKNSKPDIVFLDIQMDEISGLEVMEIIGSETKVIFCSAYSEFAIKSYDLEAIDYLMKPVSFTRFLKSIERYKKVISNQSSFINDNIPDDYIFIKTEQKGKLFKIDLNEVDFIEGMSNYVAFHCGKQKTVAYLKMRELEERLSSSSFIRVHKSYIVAIKRITFLENNEILLKNRTEKIPLSLNYKESFLAKMKDKLFF